MSAMLLQLRRSGWSDCGLCCGFYVDATTLACKEAERCLAFLLFDVPFYCWPLSFSCCLFIIIIIISRMRSHRVRLSGESLLTFAATLCSRFQSTTSSSGDETSSTQQEKYTYVKSTQFSAAERKKMKMRWENAFYGRIHYEPGMRETYQSAIHEEETMNEALAKEWAEKEKVTKRTSSAGSSAAPACDNSSAASEATSEFPPRDGSSVPIEELHERNPDEIKRYILDRLVRAERRIKHAPSYGGSAMMSHLHQGTEFLDEAEMLLNTFGGMNDSLRLCIEKLRDERLHILQEYDLD